MSIQTKLSAGVLSRHTVWQEKEEWLQAQERSEKEWANLNPEERTAIIEIVDRHLERLRAQLEELVPLALRVERGHYLDIQIRLLFADLATELKVQDEVTQRQIRDAVIGTARLLEDGHRGGERT